MQLTLRLGLLVLGVSALMVAQSPPPVNMHYVADGAGADLSASSPSTYYYLSFSETDVKGKDRYEGAWLQFYACSMLPPGTTGAVRQLCVNGSGPIPATSLKASGQKITLDVADAGALPVPFYSSAMWCDMYFCEYGPLPTPWPIRVTVQATDWMEVDENTSYTQRYRMPDGSTWSQSSRGMRTLRSATATGVLGQLAIDPAGQATLTDSRSMSHTISRTKGPNNPKKP